MGRRKRTASALREYLKRKHPRLLPRLGRVHDKVLARKLRIPRSTIHAWRVRLGIPTVPRVYGEEQLRIRHPGAIELLGKLYDDEIARRYGVTRAAVQLWRAGLGIASARHFRLQVPYADRIEARYPGLRARLGQASDPQVGKEFGFHASYAGTIRRKLGIPAHRLPPWGRHGEAMYAMRLAGQKWVDIARAFGVPHEPSAIASARRWAQAHQKPWPLRRTRSSGGKVLPGPRTTSEVRD